MKFLSFTYFSQNSSMFNSVIYANERVDVIHSLIFFIVLIIQYFNFHGFDNKDPIV